MSKTGIEVFSGDADDLILVLVPRMPTISAIGHDSLFLSMRRRESRILLPQLITARQTHAFHCMSAWSDAGDARRRPVHAAPLVEVDSSTALLESSSPRGGTSS